MKRNLEAARSAYQRGDTESSRLAHEGACPAQEAGHGWMPQGYSLAACEARLAALLTAVFVGALWAADAPAAVVDDGRAAAAFALGVAVLRGVARWLAERRERARYFHERAREEWELKNYRVGEINEMIELYESRGCGPEDARTAIEALARHAEFFVDLMMVEELQLPHPPKEPAAALALAVAAASAAFGLLPLLPLAWLGGGAAVAACVGVACLVSLPLGAMLAARMHVGPAGAVGMEVVQVAVVGGVVVGLGVCLS